MSGLHSKCIAGVFSLMLVNNIGICAEPTHETLRDPFKRPSKLDALVAAATAPKNSDVDARIDLRATLTAGDDSLVNVGGDFYKIGDLVDGSRLSVVDEGKAIFIRDGTRITVRVDENVLDD